MSFLRNALSLLATSTIVAPLGLLTSVVLARLLGAESLGAYSVLVNFATIGVLLSALGWPSAAIYRLRRERVDSPLVATTGLFAMASISLAILLLGWVSEPFVVARLLDGENQLAYRIALFLIPAQLFGRFFVALARGIDRFDLANRYRVALAAGTVLALAVVLGTGEALLLEAIAAFLAVHVLTALGLGLVVLRLTGVALFFSGEELKQSLRYGSKTYVQSIAGQLHEQVDVLMLAFFAVAAPQIAFYAIAVGVVNRLKIIPESISAALFPHVASIDPVQAGEFAARAARHSTIWVWVSAAALGLASPLLVPLVFGEPYAASVLPILILLPGVALLTTYSVLARFFMAINKQGITVRTQIVSLSANVGLNVFLIPEFGIAGAALASLVSYAIEMILIVLAFRAETGERISRTLVVDRADLAEYVERWRNRG